jgi:hypothetical protein
MNLNSSTANVLSFLFPWQRTRLVVEQMGGEVARECRADFWRRLSRRVVGMSVAEVRGYARALAEGAVVAEVDHVIERRRLTLALRDRVVASGVDQLVSLAVRDALSEESPVSARPLAA